jgi:hypothetical protein
MPPRPVNRAPPAAVQAAIEPTEEILLPPTDVTTTESTGQASLLPALSPAHVNDGVINYSTSDGMKLYNVSIAPLPIKEFEGNGGNTQTWINDLIERSEAMNWTFILTVIINGVGFFIPRCLTLTIQQVQTHSLAYLYASNGRPKQNSAVLFRCLYASIGPRLRTKICNRRSDYIINVQGQEFADGACFLRAILQHLYIDTPSTAYFKRSQLSDLPAIMKLAEGNISNFNERIRTLLNELASVGQVMNNEDLLINLMKGYEAAPDKLFVKQMQDKHNRIMYYNDPDRDMEQIMRFAEHFWTDRTNNSAWGKPSHEEQQLLALTAQIKNFKPNNGSTWKQNPSKSTTISAPSRASQKNNGNKAYARFDPYAADQAWKWVPPRSGEGKTKTLKNKTFHWCLNHQHRDTKKRGMWVAHEPSKCKAKSSTVSQNEATRDNSTSTGTAMASIINAYEDSQE